MYKQEIPAEFIARQNRFQSNELSLEQERYLRLAADFDNYKKRMAREIDRRAASQKEALVRDLLPIADNLERALMAKIRSDESFFKGVSMVFDQLLDCLKQHGFEPRHDLGEPFDEKFHDALAVGCDARKPDHSVLEVWERRWMRGSEIFRPARVVVNNLESEAKNAA